MSDRFVVRDASGPGWEWLPDWVVVDTARQVRVAAYDDQASACADAGERNRDQRVASDLRTLAALEDSDGD